jgi:hypothetical protein
MAASTIYDVKLRYAMEDKASRGVKALTGHIGAAARESQALSGTFRSLATAASGFFGLRAAKAAFIDFNSEMEQAGLTMQGLLQMNMGGTWAQNQKRANDLMAKFQVDAKSSVATTKDFVNVAAGMLGPLGRAGASLKDIQEITKGTVIAAGAFGISGEVASRDIEQALAGRMGISDRLPKLLGMDPESWNKMMAKNPSKAIPELLKVLNQPALKNMAEAQGKTFAGQWSTLKDNVQMALGKVGLPLMQAMAAEFKKITEWMERNPEKVAAFISKASDALITAFGMVKSALKFLWDNRELLMTLAKAFLAFKVVKGATNVLAGYGMSMVSAMTSFTAASGEAQKGMAGFAAKLPGIAQGLALFGAGAALVADKLYSNAIEDLESREASKFSSDRARYLAGSKVGGMTLDRMKLMQNEAERRGYSNDEGAVMLGDAHGIRKNQLESGKYTAADKLAGAGLLNDIAQQAGLKQGIVEAKKITVRDVAKIQGRTGMVDVMQKMQDRGYTGSHSALMNMTPDQLVRLLGAKDMAGLMSENPNTREGKGFIEALVGVSRALEMHGGLIANLTLKAQNDQAMAFVKSTVDAAADSIGKKGPPGLKPSINVQMKVEVKSDDPDRFVMDLSKAFEGAVKNPSMAYNSFREG